MHVPVVNLLALLALTLLFAATTAGTPDPATTATATTTNTTPPPSAVDATTVNADGLRREGPVMFCYKEGSKWPDRELARGLGHRFCGEIVREVDYYGPGNVVFAAGWWTKRCWGVRRGGGGDVDWYVLAAHVVDGVEPTRGDANGDGVFDCVGLMDQTVRNCKRGGYSVNLPAMDFEFRYVSNP
jgi:hypothetical protein